MTEQTKEKVAIFGRHGIIVSSAIVLGALCAISSWGRNLFVAPVVEDKLGVFRKEVAQEFREQAATNAAILSELHKVSIVTAELRTEVRMLNRGRRGGGE